MKKWFFILLALLLTGCGSTQQKFRLQILNELPVETVIKALDNPPSDQVAQDIATISVDTALVLYQERMVDTTTNEGSSFREEILNKTITNAISNQLQHHGFAPEGSKEGTTLRVIVEDVLVTNLNNVFYDYTAVHIRGRVARLTGHTILVEENHDVHIKFEGSPSQFAGYSHSPAKDTGISADEKAAYEAIYLAARYFIYVFLETQQDDKRAQLEGSNDNPEELLMAQQAVATQAQQEFAQETQEKVISTAIATKTRKQSQLAAKARQRLEATPDSSDQEILVESREMIVKSQKVVESAITTQKEEPALTSAESSKGLSNTEERILGWPLTRR
ncbi:MAG: hypothetical protein HQL52_10360 [Magnetococcales bacterium]|nr:hypothetical protein [Magnetococcales bacterium]